MVFDAKTRLLGVVDIGSECGEIWLSYWLEDMVGVHLLI